MSQDINCPNCGIGNPEGSKFCNNCGTKLPPPDKIACMNCGELNPRDVVYCDNCGARLETGKLPEPEPEQPEQPRSSLSNKIFSLPTRDPGDTGELDPNTLPDWLRTGDTIAGQVQSPFADESNTKPLTLEDLTNKGSTGDLPDWLVHEGDTSSELFEPPRDITTEAYLEMIGQDPTDMISDEAREMAASAELPDWLTDVVGTDVNLTPADPADTETPDSGLLLTNMPDWLAELNQSESTPQPEDPPLEDIDLSAPAESGWLNEQDEEPNEDDFSWLEDNASSADTSDSFTELFGEAPSSPPEAEDDELGWLEADFTDTTTQESTNTDDATGFTALFGDDSDAQDAEDLSWLESGDSATPSDETGFTGLFGDESETDTKDTDRTEEESDSTEKAELESWFDFADTPSEEPAVQEEVPDWLNELGKPETDLFTREEDFGSDPAWQETTPEPDPEDISLDALFGETDVNEAKADNTLADWLQELDSPESDNAPATDDDIPDWLADVGEPETLSQDELLQTDDGSIGTVFSATEEAEDMSPDWLTDLGDASSPSADTFESDIPDWLLDDAPQQTTSPTNQTVEEDIPDWLTTTEETASSPAIEEISETDDDFSWMDDLDASASANSDDELPDWLGDLSPATDTNEEIEDDVTVAGFTGLLQDDASSSTDSPDSDSVSQMVQGDMPSWLGSLETDSGISSDVPDWLSDLGSEPDLDSEPTLEADFMDDLLSEDRGYDATSALDWLSVADNVPDEADAEELDWLAEDSEEDTSSPAKKPVLLSDLEEDSTSIGAFPDWLEAIDEGLFADVDLDDDPEPETVESEEQQSDPEISEPISAVEEPDPDIASEPDDLFDDDFAIEQTDLPDWLSQLGDAEETPEQPNDTELARNEDVPLWLSDMRPAKEDTEGSSLSGFGDIDDLPGRLEEIPAELVGADLPDWLQADDLTIVPGTTQEIPDWLQAIEAERGGDVDSGLLDLGDQPVAPSDWLEELPPSRDPREELVKTDIPDWVAAMKPQILSGDTDIQAPRGEKVAQGPLSGIRGAIAIQEIVTLPRAAVKPLSQFTLTSEQTKQTELLQQLQRMEMTTAVASQAPPNIRATGRGLFALLLLVAVILGIIIGNSTDLINVPAPNPALVATYEQIEAFSGETVLVAFDYTPTMSGELNRTAEIILSQLDQNNNQILTLSGYATGTSLAETLTADINTSNLGYLPAEAVGLRQLAGCLSEGCETLYGRTPEIALEEVDLIIVLTGEQDNLLNWMEQVQTATELPLVAGVPQSIAPVADLYLQSGQLTGLIAGANATHAYQQNYDIQADTGLSAALTGQIFAQLLIVLIILLTIGRAIIRRRQEGS